MINGAMMTTVVVRSTGFVGEALIAAGRMRAGLDTIELAAARGWNPALYERIARAKLSVGDTAGALVLLARVAADPSASSGYADSVWRAVGSGTASSHWTRLLMDGRSMMRARLLAESVTRPIRGNIRLVDTAGRETTLDAALQGSVTTIIFWSRFCPPAIDGLPEIGSLAAETRRRGGNVIMIVDEPITADIRAYAASHGITLPLYYDARHEAHIAFQSWGTPQYHIVDATGTLRFPFAPLDGLVARTVVLLPDDAPPVRAP